MKRNVRPIKEEMAKMKSLFDTEGNVHEKLSTKAEDDFERGWHDGVSCMYRMTARSIKRWLYEEGMTPQEIHTDLKNLIDVFVGFANKVPSPNDTGFMKGTYTSSALKSEELLLILRSWHEHLAPKRRWFKPA